MLNEIRNLIREKHNNIPESEISDDIIRKIISELDSCKKDNNVDWIIQKYFPKHQLMFRKSDAENFLHAIIK